MYHPPSFYLRRAAAAMERAIYARTYSAPAKISLMAAASWVRLAIKARAWAADDWTTYHKD